MQRRQFLQNTTLVAASLWLAPTRAAAVRTGLVYDDRFLDHVITPDHPESPRRLETLRAHFRERELWSRLVPIRPRQHPGAALEAIHTAEHIGGIAERYPDSHDIALLASGGAVAAVDAVMAGTVDNAFCASRPPGHHALNTGREEGFCFYNHVAIAARHLQQEHGLKRILIVDWDYHHGNGTEAAFYDDPDVLFFSTHDVDAYPGTGRASRTGTGAGAGFNINVPLSCGADDADIRRAFSDRLLPAADDFKPEFVLISAGFDSRKSDLLGCFAITDAGFRQLTTMMRELAGRHCNGRLVSILEGGYNLKGNASAAAAHVETLLEDA
ncbi:acetoin utilization deacetylase AcuC-like enzyme [Methylohalomonas lacus]|uniref:Acetoin utilization deacetylase AcuC-like enzyme n=1 Tax=Methylohalomonas lacus TaxID=398773 RepID=A0AAE3HKS2_9GAMM|nr:histone deacetylase [Methylohalomonas lacus]MCS3902767.1 acetoin utilization deacetylase AcuC-like enzyme [Methylohalomonas lacus]